MARHPERPHASNYISALIKDFQTLSGDRSFAEDNAIISGIGSLMAKQLWWLGMKKVMIQQAVLNIILEWLNLKGIEKLSVNEISR